jgi:hypothetical protein
MNRLPSLLGAAIFALSACVSPPPSPPAPLAAADEDSAAKQFVPAEGLANVYIVQQGSTFGPKVGIAVEMDGKSLGFLGVGTYFLVPVNPGRHRIQLPEGGDFAWLQIDAAAGKNYFYTVSPGSASNAKPTLAIVLLESMGKAMVRQYPRAQASQ